MYPIGCIETSDYNMKLKTLFRKCRSKRNQPRGLRPNIRIICFVLSQTQSLASSFSLLFWCFLGARCWISRKAGEQSLCYPFENLRVFDPTDEHSIFDLICAECLALNGEVSMMICPSGVTGLIYLNSPKRLPTASLLAYDWRSNSSPSTLYLYFARTRAKLLLALVPKNITLFNKLKHTYDQVVLLTTSCSWIIRRDIYFFDLHCFVILKSSACHCIYAIENLIIQMIHILMGALFKN